MNFKFNTVEEAILDIRQGKMVIVVDDEDRENEGDLVAAGATITGETINYMARYARGLICTPMDSDSMERLGINTMVEKNTEYFGTDFGVSVDAARTRTGISAYERAETIKKLSDKDAKEEDFVKPGHTFPLRAKKNGVLDRNGHTEATVDLVRLAGFYPSVGVCCEIMNEDGTMARLPKLMEFSRKNDIKIITVEKLIEYRKKNEALIKREAEAKLPTKYGEFKIVGYKSLIDNKENLAIVKGELKAEEEVLVRVHSKCLTGDVFGSLRCDCGNQLSYALSAIEKQGAGVVLYMDQEGRDIGLLNKLKAYMLQEKGLDTVEANLKLGFEADLREYWAAAEMLKDLGVKKVKLMTNNPEKINELNKYGIDVVSRVPINTEHVKENEFYLRTKKQKMGHLIEI
ncbi:3,4-dihydroxy 2-butanone 4-phosphate synthase/GTP cyclohydrolase II [Clostridium acetobutylicum]|uniref:Riboflavin biosynthesis protein RibBA n=1 Tax=Clostridium acetobutylicum (strain ATCC 824 / DSM 792 / JCM 1419 / IAM 19013 / LMG 5710 / NBRC 13948 / NRRL B-527 / VKM B-1787 / 2291 / W) TaxID=272562 RepID=Q97LG9_CLOAB|nr:MULTISPECIES: bifunctional 3,4-dihydroxy-2-butanone-4-phosphate synthase/GTP cyclohydrolase II [Clostridium]AAK78570.1 Riboflavin biosynthes protein RIBA (GTPcyclohydrolase/3,4-dihydroxy-2-butanone 4-phosphate synthase) [Clostridium acetobutylicum ATCC 824]ADZ19644.1 Riboflavin biosynthes protein RIBA (GTPcyclohydrolase/3,4-dihydroxy-2-butanone 4-phosphate synthase) [Clostridium acetobutylicum EA 2018]AEI33648.1 riboflavin biosynthes protein RIBA (gtpcyclohydrolase/3,4-dihydroxy-2-butanone 4-